MSRPSPLSRSRWSRYAFARRPRWIVGHVLVVVAVIVMVNLGFWQVRRLDERRTANALVESRSGEAPVALASVAERPTRAMEFRRAVATGTFDASHEVLVGYRSSRGLPGFHVVTPLSLDDGRVVLVNRGFVPLELADRWPVADAAPPRGEVTVVGLLRGDVDADARPVVPRGKATSTPRIGAVDIDAIASVLPASRRASVFDVQLELQTPAPDGFPEPLPPLDLGEGPHFSYAVQWFAFSLVTVIGWVILVRRHARREEAAVDAKSHPFD